MNISRNFILVGTLFLVVGISIGMYMGGSGKHELAPLHAHINLLGFTLMAVFGLIYHAFPNMAASGLARVHFWLHTVSALVLLIMLALLFTGRIAEEAMAPLAPLAEVGIMLGILTFLWNVWQNAK